MKMLAMLSISISYLLTSSGHPMTLIILISLQTLITCLTLMIVNPTSWFSFILFLVFMGGLMVLFIYISSLASNEKFNLNINNFSTKVMYLMSILLIAWIMYLNHQTVEFSMSTPQTFIFKMYNSSLMFPTSLTMLYLLLALVIIVNITTLEQGPLRQLK